MILTNFEIRIIGFCPSLWPSSIGSRLGRNRLWVRFLALSDIYPMFMEPTITWVPSGFSGYIWLDTKIVLKRCSYYWGYLSDIYPMFIEPTITWISSLNESIEFIEYIKWMKKGAQAPIEATFENRIVFSVRFHNMNILLNHPDVVVCLITDQISERWQYHDVRRMDESLSRQNSRCT